MNKLFILLLMIFCHIADDFYLQGWLAQAKQKSYWEKNAPDDLYKNDYKWALFIHSFSWTFMVFLPVAAFMYKFNIDYNFMIMFFINLCYHMGVDNLKANEKLINLIQDQLMHFGQIILTFMYFIVATNI